MVAGVRAPLPVAFLLLLARPALASPFPSRFCNVFVPHRILSGERSSDDTLFPDFACFFGSDALRRSPLSSRGGRILDEFQRRKLVVREQLEYRQPARPQ